MTGRKNQTAIAITISTLAPSITVGGSPNFSATVPANNDPNGIEPKNTSVYTLITRPRRASGTSVCIIALLLMITIMKLQPIPTSRASDNGSQRTHAKKNSMIGISNEPTVHRFPRFFRPPR